MNGIIYKATSPSGRAYIGKTIKSISQRRNRHYADSKRYDYAFSRALKKYPKRNDWKWKIIYCDIPIEDLNMAEICAIFTYDTYYSGYNSTEGGDGHMGHSPSKETRKKIYFQLQIQTNQRNRSCVYIQHLYPEVEMRAASPA